MPKSRTQKRPNQGDQTKEIQPSGHRVPTWSSGWKILASLFLFYHLSAMVLSPLSLPPSSDLIRTLQSGVAHYQSLLYLNHGYRFFAPNPGPSRLIRYEIKLEDGTIKKGMFPDRNAINRDYPRLLYHRWFMLSESIANMTTIDREEEIAAHLTRLSQELLEAQQGRAGRSPVQIEREIQFTQQTWNQELERRQALLRPIANVFLKENSNSQSVQLWIQVRNLPTIDDARNGIDTGDIRYLPETARFDMGTWSANGNYQKPGGKPQTELEELPPAGGKP